VGKSVLFKPLNIQTAFTFSGALFVGKSSFFCFSGAKLFHGLRSPSGRGILLVSSPRSNLAFKADAFGAA